MAALGTRLGSLLFVDDGQNRGALEETLHIVDLVHGDGNIGSVRVRHGGSGTALGCYRPGATKEICVKAGQKEPRLTFLHEIGHLLDDAGIEPGKSWRSRADDPRLAEWWSAVRATSLYARFTQLQMGKKLRVPRDWGRAYDLVDIDQRIVSDRLDARELFARSYAQFVVMTSGDTTLRAELEHARSGRDAVMYPEHWPDDDFQPILNALTTLMRNLGWRS